MPGLMHIETEKLKKGILGNYGSCKLMKLQENWGSIIVDL